jgi:hypothetical protein
MGCFTIPRALLSTPRSLRSHISLTALAHRPFTFSSALYNHACTQPQHIAPARRPAGERSRPPRAAAVTAPSRPNIRWPIDRGATGTRCPQATAWVYTMWRNPDPHVSSHPTQHIACSAALRLSSTLRRGARKAVRGELGMGGGGGSESSYACGSSASFRPPSSPCSPHNQLRVQGVFRNAPRGAHAALAPTQLREVWTSECPSRGGCGATSVDGGHVSPTVGGRPWIAPWPL